jgi:hypothetical protein
MKKRSFVTFTPDFLTQKEQTQFVHKLDFSLWACSIKLLGPQLFKYSNKLECWSVLIFVSKA